MKTNIVILLTDDQRFDTIAACGAQQVPTPHLDRLAASGVRFTHACIPGGTSAAICMPSRAMLHTGRTLFHLEDAGQIIPEDHVLLGEHYRAQGYAAHGIGKWHNGSAAYARSFSSGGEIFFGGMTDHWNVPACHFDPAGVYAMDCPHVVDFQTQAVQERACDHIQPGRHSTQLFADEAVRFLEQHDADHPFLLYVSFLAPHDPRTLPASYRERIDVEALEMPPNFRPQHPFDFGAFHIRDEELAPFPRTPAIVRREMALYLAMIVQIDDQVGRIMEVLARRGLRDTTLVVFASDNGLALGQHGLMGKQNCYDHSLRVPLIFAGPGVPQGVRRDAGVYLLDVFPTLCDLTGHPIPSTVEGHSLVPLLHDGAATVRDSLFAAYTDCQRCVRQGDHKLIEYQVNGVRHTQLFNLREDPWETRNLAANPAQAQRLVALRARLCRWRDEWEDAATPWGQRFWKGCPDLDTAFAR